MWKKNRPTDFSKSSFHLGSHWSEPVRRSLSERDISLGTWSYTYFFLDWLLIDTYRSTVWSDLKRGYWVWLFLRWKNVWKTIQQRDSAGVGVWDDTVTVDQSLSPDHEVQAFRMLQKGSLFSVGLIWTFNHYYWAINQDPNLSQIFDCHFFHRWTSVLCSVFTLWIKCDDSLEIPEPAPRRILLHVHYSYKSFNYSRPHAFHFPALRNESFFFFFGPSHMQNLKKKITNAAAVPYAVSYVHMVSWLC